MEKQDNFHTTSYNRCRLAKQDNVVQGSHSKLGLPVATWVLPFLSCKQLLLTFTTSIPNHLANVLKTARRVAQNEANVKFHSE